MAVITFNLNIPAAQLQQVKQLLGDLKVYMDKPKVKKVIDAWPTLPQEVKDEIVEKAPVFGKIVAFAERFHS